MFNRLDMLAEPMLVYERGDTFDQALASVDAIAPDPGAGRAQRAPVHPAIEPIAEDLARPTRILLTELLTAGLLIVELIDLADAEEDEAADGRFVTRSGGVAPRCKPAGSRAARHPCRPPA